MDFGDYSNSLPPLLRLKLARRSFMPRHAQPAAHIGRSADAQHRFPFLRLTKGRRPSPGDLCLNGQNGDSLHHVQARSAV